MYSDSSYRLVRPEEGLALRGLRVLVGGPESAPGVPEAGIGRLPEIQEKVNGFLAYAESIGLDIRRQVLAMELIHGAESGESEGAIKGMCLWVPAPGHTGMLFAPGVSEFPATAAATQQAILGALKDAREAGVVLVQAMLEPSDAAGKTVFAEAGLAQLATLTYMERKPPIQPPAFELPRELALVAYETSTHDLFRQAIAESYIGTLDCPAMSGMRAVEDVMAGHKSVGRFDPQLWTVLMERGAGSAMVGKPLGCLLLAEIPARQGLELVYLGLAPEARGRRLGRLLMQRVLSVASRRQFAVATLAVDAANMPAVKLYRRCGYTSVAQRVAMIKQL